MAAGPHHRESNGFGVQPHPYLCALRGDRVERGMSLGDAQVVAAGTVIGMRTVVNLDSVREREP